MTKILVKNGDWDKARAELGANLEAKRNTFDSQFAAAFGAPKKAAAAPAPEAKTTSSAKLILARPRG